MSFLWFSVKRVIKSFRNFNLLKYPESKLVVCQPDKFRIFNQIKLAYANISDFNSTRKPCLLFNEKIWVLDWANLWYWMDIMGGFVKVEIDFQFIIE